jgi:hypothetical protein
MLPEAGDDCVPTPFQCDPDRAYCNMATMKCVAQGLPGATCTVGQSCVHWAQCTDGMCVARSGVGGSCNPNNTRDCLAQLSCVAGKCVDEAVPLCK